MTDRTAEQPRCVHSKTWIGCQSCHRRALSELSGLRGRVEQLEAAVRSQDAVYDNMRDNYGILNKELKQAYKALGQRDEELKRLRDENRKLSVANYILAGIILIGTILIVFL